MTKAIIQTLGLIGTVSNSLSYLSDKLYRLKQNYILRLRNGLQIELRPQVRGVVSDLDIVEEVILNNQYKIDFATDYRVVVDIGAQIGTFSLMMASVSPQAQVYAFEPNPENFQLLARNKSLNQLDNLYVFPLAVTGKEQEQVPLFIDSQNRGGHTLFGHGEMERVTVNAITLQNLFRENSITHVDLLKVDCEGGEYKIILDSEPEIWSTIKELVLEIHETPETLKSYSRKELLDYLGRIGFMYEIMREIYYPDEGRFWIVRAYNQNLSN